MNHLVNRFKLRSLLTSSALLAVVTGCSHSPLPPCVQGTDAPTPAQKALWSGVSKATSIDLGIDGSGSMLGFTGSAVTLNSWRDLIQGVKTASAEQDLTVNAQRIGGGNLQSLDDPVKASNPCFFSDCGEFQDVTSSLHSLWTAQNLSQDSPPLRVLISDLEVNGRDISSVIKAIRPHTKAGAVIGILALKLPFNGKVFDSSGSVIFEGEAQRPIYILASGPQVQVKPLLQSIKQMMPVTTSVKMSFLEEWVNRRTITVKSLAGIPSSKIYPDQPISLGNKKYFGVADYGFTKFEKGLNSLILSSGNSYLPMTNQPVIRIGESLQKISLPGHNTSLDGVYTGEVKVEGAVLQVKLNTERVTDGKALRAVIPRGQLPEDWWIQWDRTSKVNQVPQDQTEGLFNLMKVLGLLFVAKDTTPAASFCVLTSLTSS